MSVSSGVEFGDSIPQRHWKQHVAVFFQTVPHDAFGNDWDDIAEITTRDEVIELDVVGYNRGGCDKSRRRVYSAVKRRSPRD